jgi:hypothetical protein
MVSEDAAVENFLVGAAFRGFQIGNIIALFDVFLCDDLHESKKFEHCKAENASVQRYCSERMKHSRLAHYLTKCGVQRNLRGYLVMETCNPFRLGRPIGSTGREL